jgi:hypothetical protein
MDTSLPAENSPIRPAPLAARPLLWGQARRALILLALTVLLPLGLLIVASQTASTPHEVDPAQIASLEAAWGIRITNVAVIATGGLVDLRFQVIDPDKALGILDPDDAPVLIDAATGKVLDKGAAHGGHNAGGFKPGRTYYFLFQNNGALLKPGSRVTIKIGDVRLENFPVR